MIVGAPLGGRHDSGGLLGGRHDSGGDIMCFPQCSLVNVIGVLDWATRSQ